MKNFIKVNVPLTEEDYLHGNGEGMWAIVDDETKKAYDEDVISGTYEATLDNDSLYWAGLEHGQVVPIEMRGEYKPVVPYNWLFAMFGW